MEEIPRLANGKIDYPSILQNFTPNKDDKSQNRKNFFKIILSRKYWFRFMHEAACLIGLRDNSWNSVESIFAIFIKNSNINKNKSFRDSGGDSLTYLQVSMALEEYIGHLPTGWDRMTIEELEGLKYETSL